MAQIDSAYFGDDLAVRNVTKSLRGKVLGGKLDVKSNSELIPAFNVPPEVKLDPSDEKEIMDEVLTLCKAIDTVCINSTKNRLRQGKLMKKERASMSTANTVTGRRLTVNLVEKGGKRRTVVVPDGQQLTLENIEGAIDMTTVAGFQVPKWSFFEAKLANLASWFGLALVQAFGLVAFVMMLRDEAPAFWQKYVLQAGWASVAAGALVGFVLLLIPFGALGIVGVYYLIKGVLNEYYK